MRPEAPDRSHVGSGDGPDSEFPRAPQGSNSVFPLGSPCSIRLSYGAVAQEDSALNSVSK